MKRIIVLAFLTLTFLSLSVFTQEYFKDLNGFRLKQYREVPGNELGKPFKSDKFDDGIEYEAFSLKPDNSAYMVFEFAPDQKDIVWSIQMTSIDPTVDPSFRDLRFGMPAAEVEKLIGKPTEKISIGEHGFRWQYGDSNFSVEINPSGKLASIKLTDISDRAYPSVDAKKIPNFNRIVQTLTSKDSADIAKLLAPDMELYRGKETQFLSRSLRNEIVKDHSKMFSEVRKIGEELKTVNSKSLSEYEENMRLTLGQQPKHVMKFKKSANLREIVFKYEWGEFVIWEIHLK